MTKDERVWHVISCPQQRITTDQTLRIGNRPDQQFHVQNADALAMQLPRDLGREKPEWHTERENPRKKSHTLSRTEWYRYIPYSRQ